MTDTEYYQKVTFLLISLKKGSKKIPQPQRLQYQNMIQSLIDKSEQLNSITK